MQEVMSYIDRNTSLLEDYINDAPMCDIVEKHGICRERVRQILKGMNVKKRTRGESIKLGKRFKSEIIERNKNVMEDYINNVLVKEICSKHGITKDTISRIRRNAGIPKRVVNPANKKIHDINAFIDDYKNGMSYKDMSIKWDISAHYVYMLLMRKGIERTRRRKCDSI